MLYFLLQETPEELEEDQRALQEERAMNDSLKEKTAMDV